MKGLPLPRIFLALVLALTLALVPLTPAMAEVNLSFNSSPAGDGASFAPDCIGDEDGLSVTGYAYFRYHDMYPGSEEGFQAAIDELEENLSKIIGNEDGNDSNAGTNGVPSDGGYYLPSPDAWFGNRMARNEEDSDSVAFVLKLDDLPALNGYEELLKDERFGLKLSDTFKVEYLDIPSPVRYTYYVFDRKDGALSPYEYDVGLTQTKGDVILIIQEKFLEDYCALIIYFNNSFQFVDVGDVYPYADRLTDRSAHPFTSSGGSSSSGSSSSSGRSGRQCSSCGGRGKEDCKSCYGKGYVEEYTWGEGGSRVRKNCPNINCHGGKVDCRVCGGDGWID